MVRSSLHFVLAIALVSACMPLGCRKPDPVAETSSSHDTPASKAPMVRQQTWTLSDSPVPPRDDPADDGWQTEAFNSAATSQLKLLGELAIGQAATDDLSSLLSPAFQGGPLPPTPLSIVHRDDLFTVERWTPSGERGALTPEGEGQSELAASDTSTRLSAMSRQLCSLLDGYDSDKKFKFKIIRVDLNASGAETIQFASFSGASAHASKEINATWRIQWEQSTGNEPPMIKSIAVLAHEQVTYDDNAPHLFSDGTERVLGKLPAYRTALSQGIPYWRDRLSKQLGVYNFGHHGLAIGDVNGDGRDDVYICETGGIPNHLFIQQPDGTAVDVSSMANVDYLDNTRSALFLDLDNDGDQDLILALTTGLLFCENVSREGAFSFRLRARIPSVRQAFSLAAADYDDDGDLDLFVCVYYGDSDTVSELPYPLPYFDANNGGSNFLIQNEGNWRFGDITEAVGLDVDNSRFTLAAAWEDYDNDGDPDLMVVNDFGPNQLFENSDGTFSDVARETGLLDGAFGMSASFADFDHNGRMDLYVSNMFSSAGNRVTTQPRFKTGLSVSQKAKYQYLARGNSLFRNVEERRFEDVSESHGVTLGRWSWGSLFADVNNDGWDDLLVANGYVTGQSVDDL